MKKLIILGLLFLFITSVLASSAFAYYNYRTKTHYTYATYASSPSYGSYSYRSYPSSYRSYPSYSYGRSYFYSTYNPSGASMYSRPSYHGHSGYYRSNSLYSNPRYFGHHY